MPETSPTSFSIRRCAYHRCYEVVMYLRARQQFIAVQTNLYTLEKAEAALQRWIQIDKDTRRAPPTSDVPARR